MTGKLSYTYLGGVPVIAEEIDGILCVYENVDEIEKAMRKIDLWLLT